MVKRSRHGEMRFESVVVGGIRSEYGTIAGSIPALTTTSGYRHSRPDGGMGIHRRLVLLTIRSHDLKLNSRPERYRFESCSGCKK